LEKFFEENKKYIFIVLILGFDVVSEEIIKEKHITILIPNKILSNVLLSDFKLFKHSFYLIHQVKLLNNDLIFYRNQ